MALGLVLKETMSGWLKMDDDGRQRAFAFSLQSFTPQIFTLNAPRSFRGTVEMDGEQYPCRGELTLHTSGPHYWLDFRHPELGMLHVEGKKEYSLKALKHSLTTCPMVVYHDGRRVGEAEAAYRDSMLTFPFKAFRLAREENAFGEYGGQL